jgi:hypothetical protein
LNFSRIAKALVVFSIFIGFAAKHPAQAGPPQGWKARELSQADEKKWIEAVKQRKTADGATVWQVLQYAEKMRPKKFKAGVIEVGYDGGSGDPDGVGIGYWIGMKRLEGDSFTDLWYDIKTEKGIVNATPRQNKNTSETIINAMELGRDNFLIYIDKMYIETCVDLDTKQKLC